MTLFKRLLFYFMAAAVAIPSGLQAQALYDESYQANARKLYLQAFYDIKNTEQQPEDQQSVARQFAQALYEVTVKPLVTKFQYPKVEFSDIDRFSMATRIRPPWSFESQAVIDIELLEKLDILRGSSDKKESLIKQLATVKQGDAIEWLIYTTMGNTLLGDFISMPTSDSAELLRRQAIIRELFTNDGLRTKLVTFFKEMGKNDPFLLQYYNWGYSRLPLDFNLYPNWLLDLFGSDFKINKIPWVITILEKSLNLTILLGTIGYLSTMQKAAKTSVSDIKYFVKSDNKLANIKDLRYPIAGLGSAATAPITASTLLSSLKRQITGMLAMQRRLINVANYIRSSHAIIKLLSLNSAIAKAIPDLLKEFMPYAQNKFGSDDFRKLNELLAGSTFDNKEPSTMASSGTILVTNRMMSHRTREEFAKLLSFIATIEVYTAMAQKMKAHEKDEARFCFVDLNASRQKPFIDAQALWNPFIARDKAIVNTVALNTDGASRDILLTGPNTSGKSTFVKAVMINLIMAQSFGIACAQSMRITPFNKLLSYANIKDDVVAGISQFKAETIRAAQLKNVVQLLKPEEFAFFILDEIFTGTSPEHAEKLSYIFIRNLTKYPRLLFINATHFKKLGMLESETNGIIKNYYLSADVDNQGKVLKYTRKLTPGIAPYSSAEQVAQEAGITEEWGD